MLTPAEEAVLDDVEARSQRGVLYRFGHKRSRDQRRSQRARNKRRKRRPPVSASEQGGANPSQQRWCNLKPAFLTALATPRDETELAAGPAAKMEDTGLDPGLRRAHRCRRIEL